MSSFFGDMGGTASEHVQWCKERALAELDQGGIAPAWASLCSDLSKHADTRDHAGIELGMMMLLGGHLSTVGAMRDFIKGFN